MLLRLFGFGCVVVSTLSSFDAIVVRRSDAVVVFDAIVVRAIVGLFVLSIVVVVVIVVDRSSVVVLRSSICSFVVHGDVVVCRCEHRCRLRSVVIVSSFVYRSHMSSSVVDSLSSDIVFVVVSTVVVVSFDRRRRRRRCRRLRLANDRLRLVSSSSSRTSSLSRLSTMLQSAAKPAFSVGSAIDLDDRLLLLLLRLLLAVDLVE